MKPLSYPLFLSVVLLVNISLAAKAQTATPCIDTALINRLAVCPDIVAPVCGCNGVTYSNSCIAENYYGVTSWTPGACGSLGACKASFTYCAEALGSIGITFQFTNTSIGGYTSVLWTFSDGDTSTLPDPRHTFVTAAAVNTACLTINSIDASAGAVACTGTVCDTLSTTSPPCGSTQPCQASFTDSIVPAPVAYGLIDIAFVNTSRGSYTNSLWVFGDGDSSTAQNPTHIFKTTKPYYVVCLTISDSANTCRSTVCDTVIIPNPIVTCQASFTDSILPVTTPTSGVDVAFFNTSQETYITSVWSFGDGVSYVGPNPTHIFNSDKPYYVVCLTISDSATSCSSTICDTVFIPRTSVPCKASFTYHIVLAPVAVGLIDIGFVNTSTGNYTSSLWTFGDGDSSTAQSPSHLYSTTDPYYIACLTISNSAGNCNSTICDTIRMPHPVPCIDSSRINDRIPCPAIYAPVCGCNGISYSNACEAEYRYGVTSWTQGACTSGTCKASFITAMIPSPTAVSVFAVHFINTSTGSYTHSFWTFGDGDSSTAKDPEHTYREYAPYYIVCLTISDSTDSCSSTVCDTIHFNEPPKCIDTSRIDRHAVCPDIVFPVCGCDSVTYINSCVAENYFGVTSWTIGACGGHIWPRPVVGGVSAGGGVGSSTGGGVGRIAGISSVSEETLNLSLYPNPAGDKTNIVYNLSDPANVVVDLVDMLGRSVSQVFNGDQTAGQQLFTVNTNSLGSGIYMVRVTINGQMFTRQLSVVH